MSDKSGSVRDTANARHSPSRLRAVRETGLLDQPSTEGLDRLSRLAATLIEAPVAFVSLVDAERDFYVSQSGFPEPLASAREQRGETFCHYAMVQGGPLVIGDTRADPRYSSVPTVESLGVAAYIGIPMKSPEGEVIGSFCAIDFVPRAWTPRQVELMTELAASAAHEIGLARLAGLRMRQADDAYSGRLAAENIAAERLQLVSAVSHDLRDPLGAILLALKALEAVPGDARVERTTAVIRRQANRMTGLLEDLLDMARIDSGKLEIAWENVDVAALLSEIADDFAIQSEARGVTIVNSTLEHMPPVAGERKRLLQALANLVSNALKFTPHGGEVRLSAHLHGPFVRIEVADTGCGIDAAQLDRVFDPFWQGERVSRDGIGLGLYLVRGIVERHGGSIRVRSTVGQGTTFEIDITAARAS